MRVGRGRACGIGAGPYGVVGAGVAFAAWLCGTVRAGVLLLPRTVATLAQAEIVIGNLDRTVARTLTVFDVLQHLLVRAAGTLDDARVLLDETGRLMTLLNVYESPLTDLAPVLGRIAETVNPAEVDAITDLAGQLRAMLTDDLPSLLHRLRALSPDARGALDSLAGLERGLRNRAAPTEHDTGSGAQERGCPPQGEPLPPEAD